MAIDPVTFLTNLGLPQILLWLLTFAILQGVLTQVNTPKSKMARALISIVIAFMVILAAPIALINLLSQMSAALILIILGILVIVVFIEVAGAKSVVIEDTGKKDKEGNPMYARKEVSIFERYGYLFAITFLIIAIFIFISAGGMEILGFESAPFDVSSPGTSTLVFFIVILIAIVYMVVNPS